MGVEIKRGQGKIVPSEELEEVKWEKLERKDRIQYKDHMMLYGVFSALPESYSDISLETRKKYIEHYEQARDNRAQYGIFSLGGVGGICTFGWLTKAFSFKTGIIGSIGGGILTQALNVLVFERFYNKQHLDVMKQIAKENYQYLDDPKMLQLNQDYLKVAPDFKQFLKDQEEEVKIYQEAGDEDQAKTRIEEIRQNREDQLLKMQNVFVENNNNNEQKQ